MTSGTGNKIKYLHLIHQNNSKFQVSKSCTKSENCNSSNWSLDMLLNFIQLIDDKVSMKLENTYEQNYKINTYDEQSREVSPDTHNFISWDEKEMYSSVNKQETSKPEFTVPNTRDQLIWFDKSKQFKYNNLI